MSTSRTIALAAILFLGNCPRDPTASVERDPVADAMQRRGEELLDEKLYAEAISPLFEAMSRHLARADRAAASIDFALLSRGYQATNQYRDAIGMAERARAEAARSADEGALASALLAMGDTLEHLGDHELALEVYAEAAPHLPERDTAARVRLAIYRSNALEALGRRTEARAVLEEARDVALTAGRYDLVVSATVNLADGAVSAGDLDEAERHLRAARKAQKLRRPRRVSTGLLLNESIVARLRGDLPAAAAALDQIPAKIAPDSAWHLAHERGAIAEAGGQLDLAEDRYREAIRIVEQLREDSAPGETKAPFLEQRWAPFESLFALDLRRNQAHAAFATMARAQGRMFLDALAVSLPDTGPARPSRIDAAIGRFHRLEQVQAPLATSRLALIPSPEATLAALRGKHVLAYFPADGHLRMMAVVDGEPRATSVDVDLATLDRLIDDFRRHPDVAAAAEALGSALLPLDALPAPSTRLHIVPIGPLLRVSFAALRVAGDRLLDRYEIVYAPSVTGLAAMVPETEDRGRGALVVADTRSGLEHADAESKIVVDQTGATPRVGPQATAAALRTGVDLALLHVISHSGLGARGGYLVLADREVTAADILSWRIHPRLVVLPTCASAATIRSEMWGSLAAAFLAAGSHHVVATVAAVQDSVAMEFTRLFYREGGVEDPVGALTRAQRQMAGRYPAEAWSAFVVAGL
jgi:tetratricopeptide (TPR) repeat protein